MFCYFALVYFLLAICVCIFGLFFCLKEKNRGFVIMIVFLFTMLTVMVDLFGFLVCFLCDFVVVCFCFFSLLFVLLVFFLKWE